jgi:hypothetical protein
MEDQEISYKVPPHGLIDSYSELGNPLFLYSPKILVTINAGQFSPVPVYTY